MNEDIKRFNEALEKNERDICNILAEEINHELPKAQSKLWHGAPVWFIEGNPIVGYDTLKDCVRLLFWSGQSFAERELKPEGSFKAAEIRYTEPEQIDINKLHNWLAKAGKIQWDYKNIVKRKGVLERLR